MKKIYKLGMAFVLATMFNSQISAQAGAALNFDPSGSPDNVFLPAAISTNSLVGKTKATIEAWVRPTSLAGLGVIVGNYSTPSNQLQFLLRRDNTGYSFGVGTGNSAGYNAVTTAANTATINVWQHVAGVFDGTVISVYINGVFSASVNATSNYTFAATTNSIIIGANGINENFTGNIDEVRLWNTNRSKCEINTFMNCEIPTNASSLVANYHFNQGTASAANATVITLMDATTNGFNGTLNTFALTGAISNWITPGGVVSNFTTTLAPPSLTVTANQSLSTCTGNTIILTASGASTYTWTGGVSNAVAFTATASTSYAVVGTAVNGCTANSVANLTTSICLGAALNFDGGSDKLNLPLSISTNSLVGLNQICVEAWAKPTTNAGLGIVFGNYTPANQLQFLLRRDGTAWSFWVGPGNANSSYTAVISAANTATLNTWQHLAGVFNGTVMTLYINGVPAASVATSNTFAVNTNTTYIGGIGAEFFTGDIDEVRLWTVARTRCQINTFMNCEIPSSAPNLIANYHFNQGIAFSPNATVTALTDATSNALTGTLTTFALTGITSNWVSSGGVVSGFTTAVVAPGYTNSALAICASGTVVLGSVGATTYTWLPSITNAAPFTPTASASYTYAGTNSVTTCSNVAVAMVTVNPNPTVTAVSSETNFICVGQSATLTASGATNYTFNPGGAGNNISISPTVTTTYTVTGADGNGCSNMATVTQSVNACTGINQLSSNVNSVIVYPNPSKDKITIQSDVNGKVSVYNMLGVMVKETIKANDKIEISLEGQSAGVYFVRLGNEVIKVIKE